MAKTKTPRQAHKEAETKLDTLRLQTEAKAMEQRLALLESPQPVMVPWQDYPAFDTWGMSPTAYQRPYIWTQPDDRNEGRYRPLYENAEEVRRQRAEARSLVELFPVARGALQKLSDYVIGNGFDFVVQPKERYKKDLFANQVADVIQEIVDRFLEHNRFIGNLDREIHEDSRVDGDSFATLYAQDGEVRIELTDPGCILEPANKRPLERMCGTDHKLNGWWHGVHTLWNPQLKRDDVTRPLGYHAVFDNLGEQWDYLHHWRVEQIKRNVGRLGRVGVSDFYTVLEDLSNEAKLRRNTAVGAAILAAIVGIRQHAEGTTQSTVESMVSGNATGSYDKALRDGGSRTTYQQHVAPGTIKDIPKGMEWLAGPMGSLNQPVYIEVAKYLQSVIGQPWSMPYFLISGDGSESNYASTLVSESPFIKYCEHEQAFYASHFERLIWKALGIYHKCGALGGYSWQQVCTLLEITAEYTSPASRDKLQQAQANQILVDAGVMSKRTLANDMGLDYDEEQANQSEEPKPAPKVVKMPFGGGGGGNPDFGGFEESRETGKWVTIKGTPVLIDDDGEVRSGPLKGKKLGADKGGSKSNRTETLAVRAIDLLLERANLREADDGEGKWITIRGNAVKIADDGTILTGALKGTKLGGKSINGDGGRSLRDAIDSFAAGSVDLVSTEYTKHEKAIASGLKSALGDSPLVRDVVHITSTQGSMYFDAIGRDDSDDEVSVTVRVSTHKGKPNAHGRPAWSFEPGDDDKTLKRGIEAIVTALRKEGAV